MKKKSITINTFFYMIRVVAGMLFPLISFPYISRILSPDGIGQYNFSVSFVSYFSLLTTSGIATYAIREGAKLRDDLKKFNYFAQEIYTINCVFSIFLNLILIAITFLFGEIEQYRTLILILSMSIPLTTIGTEWVFSVYENYSYTTINNIAFQVISILLMFLLVKNETDVYIYAFINVISTAGANIFNYIYSSKFFRHKIIWKQSSLNHLKPILFLCLSSFASQIYVNSDITILGIFKTNYDIGIYVAATKVYNILRNIFAAFITVLTPRMTYLFSKKNENDEYALKLSESFNAYLALILPVAVGTIFIADAIIMILSGVEYLEAVVPLQILACAFLFSTLGSFIANEVLVVSGRDKHILFCTLIGAITNIVGNILIIPRYSYIGAAMTTLVSEIFVFGLQFYFSTKVGEIDKMLLNLSKSIIACISIVLGCLFVDKMVTGMLLNLILKILISSISYFGLIVLFKHDSMFLIKDKILHLGFRLRIKR